MASKESMMTRIEDVDGGSRPDIEVEATFVIDWNEEAEMAEEELEQQYTFGTLGWQF